MGLGSFPSVSYVKAREKAEGMSNGTVEIITQAEIKQTKLQEQKELFAIFICTITKIEINSH